MKVLPKDVIVEDRIRQDMGEMDILKDSMDEDWQASPIIITKDNKLVDGMRRLMNHIALKGAEEPIEAFVYEGPTDPKIMEIKLDSLHKSFSYSELEEARQRILSEGKTKEEMKKEIVSSGRRNIQDQYIARKLGRPRASIERSRIIAEAKPEEVKGGKEKIKQIKKMADEKGIRPAYEELQEAKMDKQIADRPKEIPNINKWIIKYNNQLMTIFAKLEKMWEYKDQITQFNIDTLRERVDDIYQLICEE